MPVLLKVVISALVVGAINVVAQRSPSLAGWLAAFPLMTFLSVTWLWADGRENATLGDLVTGVLWGLIPNAVMLVALFICLRFGLHAVAALAVAAAVWVVSTLAAQAAGLFA